MRSERIRAKLPPRIKSVQKRTKTLTMPSEVQYSSAKLSRAVMSGFQGSIEPGRRGWMYRLGVGASALFVIVLPLLYCALICLAAWGVYWRAANNVSIASMGVGRGRVLAVMLYVAPIVAGA